jgi:hypothetical protein
MKRLTVKGVIRAIEDSGNIPVHDIPKLVDACRRTAKKFKLRPLDVFNLNCFNEPIGSVYTHSYGFLTSIGRDIVNTTQSIYYNE